jgi:hypothetical protein
VSQTSTYLKAGRHGLRDSMQRFNGIRCNPVANSEQIENEAHREREGETVNEVTVN